MSLLDDFSHEEVDEAERYMLSTLVNERNRTKSPYHYSKEQAFNHAFECTV